MAGVVGWPRVRDVRLQPDVGVALCRTVRAKPWHRAEPGTRWAGVGHHPGIRLKPDTTNRSTRLAADTTNPGTG